MLAIEIRRQGIGLQHHRQRHLLTSYTKGLFIVNAGHTPEALRTEPRPGVPVLWEVLCLQIMAVSLRPVSW